MTIQFRLFLFCGLYLIANFYANDLCAQTNIAIDYGIWKPSELDKYPTQPLKNIDGAKFYWGLSFTSPIIKGHSARLSLMQWSQYDLYEIELESVTLRQLAFDLKYIILPHYVISPYASYGAVAIWSRESTNEEQDQKIPLDRAGWGFNVGAGIDFLLCRHLAIGAEYQYLYAVFPKRVGLTENYSGPKISLKLLYIF